MNCDNTQVVLDVLRAVGKIIIDAAPTLVALLAIYFNNNSAAKRDRHNKEVDVKLKILWETCDFSNDLYLIVSELGGMAIVYAGEEEYSNEEAVKISDEYWKLDKKAIVLQRKVRTSSEIYESVGEKILDYEKYCKSSDTVRESSSKLMMDIFGDEKDTEKMKKDLESELNNFELIYNQYSKTVQNEIKNITKS